MSESRSPARPDAIGESADESQLVLLQQIRDTLESMREMLKEDIGRRRLAEARSDLSTGATRPARGERIYTPGHSDFFSSERVPSGRHDQNRR